MNAKKIFAFILMVAAVLTGCKKEEELGAAKVALNPSSLEFSQEEGSQEIRLTATREWKVEKSVDWVAVSQERGEGSSQEQVLRVTVTKNEKGNRTAKIKFTIGTDFATLVVNQAGPDGDTGGVDAVTVQEFIEMADTENYYRLEGVVSGFNAQWCSFDLTDATGKIYVYSVTEESKAEWVDKIKNGGTVVLKGKYLYYESKSQHEVVDAIIESFTAGQEENPDDVEQITCAEFIQKADPTTTYRLVGEVTTNVNATYCSFDMNDGTATVVVWTVNNASEWASVVKKGGTVTVRGKYMLYTNSETGATKHEMVDAYIEKFEAGSTGGGENPPVTGGWYEFTKATSVESGKAYAIVANSSAATPVSGDYGYLQVASVTDENGVIKTEGANAFTFTQVDGGYPIRQSDGRYLYMKGTYNSFNLDANPTSGHVFTVEPQTDGTVVITNVEMSKSLQFDTNYNSYGAYPDVRGVYPALYLQGEATEAPETPGTGGGNTGEAGDYDPQGITWTLGTNAYDNTGTGNNCQTATVNGVAVANLLKLGTSSKVGDATLHVPAGTSKIGFYCVAWKGKTATVKFTAGGTELATVSPMANVGATGNAPYTITLADADYYEVEMTSSSATDVKVETLDPANGRVLFIGLSAISE